MAVVTDQRGLPLLSDHLRFVWAHRVLVCALASDGSFTTSDARPAASDASCWACCSSSPARDESLFSTAVLAVAASSFTWLQ